MNIDSDHSEQVKIKKNPKESFNIKEEFKSDKKKVREVTLISDLTETQGIFSSSSNSFGQDEAKFVEKQINVVLNDNKSQSQRSKKSKIKTTEDPCFDSLSSITSTPVEDTFLQQAVTHLIMILERMFLDKSTHEASSQYTEKSLIPSRGSLQSKLTSCAMLPITLPYRVCRYFAMLPIKWADQLVDLGLRKFKMTKGDA